MKDRKMLKKLGSTFKLLLAVSATAIATGIVVHNNPDKIDDIIETTQSKFSKIVRRGQITINRDLATPKELATLRKEEEKKIIEKIEDLNNQREEIKSDAEKDIEEINKKIKSLQNQERNLGDLYQPSNN